MKKLILFFVLLIPGFTFSQSTISQEVKLPSILPQTPEAASLAKEGQIAVGLHNGAANASIPLYEIKMNGFSLPIALNYTSNGTKVDEIPSRVGLNWSLTAGGVIARTVQGLPDDQTTRKLKPSSLTTWNQSMYDFLNAIGVDNPGYDAEPDLYTISGPGLSGKFLFNDSGGVFKIPYSNLKIEKSGNITEFIVTNTEGLKFKFGATNATEKTSSYTLAGKAGYNQITKTAFYLYRIDFPNGDYIDFNYSSISFGTKPGISHSIRNIHDQNNNPGTPTFSQVVNSVNYNGVYLTSITSSVGHEVNFIYEDRPDESDKRVTQVIISTGSFSRSYKLSYTDQSCSGTWDHGMHCYNKRFFLKDVYSLILINNTPTYDTLRYKMDYEDINGLPQRLTYGQDHYGFYNGQSNQTLLPSGYSWAGSTYANANRSPNGSYAMKGMLKKITYPTGGYDEFEFESNGSYGGVRVKSISFYDPVANKTNKKYYSYSTALDYAAAEYASDFYVKIISPSYMQLQKVLHSNSLTALSLYDNNHIAYSTVTESDDLSFKNGGIEHQFSTWWYYGAYPLYGYAIPQTPNGAATTTHSYETRTEYFNKDFVTLKETRNYYELRYDSIYKSVNARKRYIWTATQPISQDDLDAFDAMVYESASAWIQLDSTVTDEYDVSGNRLKNKVVYEYGDTTNILTKKITTYNSTADAIINKKKYPKDINSGVYSTMANKNILSPVIEDSVLKGTSLLYSTRNEYKDWFSDGKVLSPWFVKTKKGTNSEETRITFNVYDSRGNILDVSKINDVGISYIWDYNKSFPIAETRNAKQNQIAFTSFESTEKGNWTFSGTPSQDATAPTGLFAYSLSNGNITKTVDTASTYIVSYWKKNNGTATVNSESGTALLTIGDWTCYERTLTLSASSTITISGSASIDELRLRPESSQMVTFTYQPYVGVSSTCSPNHFITYYEYDTYARLLRIRDHNRNITKQFEYKYAQTIQPCPDTVANWVNTGVDSCLKNNPTNNNNTGYKISQQRNMNNCSATYLQIGWSAPTYNTTVCPIVSNCSGSDKRVINGQCYTGTLYCLGFTYLGGGQYENSYRYWWYQDGYYGPIFTLIENFMCLND